MSFYDCSSILSFIIFFSYAVLSITYIPFISCDYYQPDVCYAMDINILRFTMAWCPWWSAIISRLPPPEGMLPFFTNINTDSCQVLSIPATCLAQRPGYRRRSAIPELRLSDSFCILWRVSLHYCSKLLRQVHHLPTHAFSRCHCYGGWWVIFVVHTCFAELGCGDNRSITESVLLSAALTYRLRDRSNQASLKSCVALASIIWL